MDWDPRFAWRSPLLEPLRLRAAALGAAWPGLDELQQLLDRGDPPVRNARGAPLRLVPPPRGRVAPDVSYEARVFLRGELAVRERDWHDLLNVMAWLNFPGAKAALNARHYFELEAQRARENGARTANRGPVRDALTLFDEGGVVVASADESLLDLLRGFRWKELFWSRRRDVTASMRFVLFGHALYEKALRPFQRVTGGGVLLSVDPQLVAAPLPELLPVLDAQVAARLADPSRFTATRELAPVPVLGVPGWCPDNERESYYENIDYFRPGRRRPGNGASPG